MQRIRYFVVLAVLAMLAIDRTHAQSVTVSGYVREQASGEPLPGAAVYALPDGRLAAVTNAAGFYTLKLAPGDYRLTGSFIGYRADTVRMVVSADTHLDWGLDVQSIQLDNVVVTARQAAAESKGLGRLVVNTRQMKYAPAFLGEADAVKYLQTLPGVSSGKEGSSQLAVRGGSGDQTLMMLDEVPVFNQNHAFGLVSIFNGDAIFGAELYKGYVPAKYGGRLSSVAAFKMRDGNRYEHHRSISIGTVAASLFAEGPIRKGRDSYLISVRRFMPDLLLRGYYATQKQYSNDLMYSFYDITAKANFSTGERNTLYFSFYNGRDRFANNHYEYESRPEGLGARTSKSGAGFWWNNTSASLRANTRIGSGGFLNTSVYFSRLGNDQYSHYRDDQKNDDSRTDIRSSLYEAGFRSVLEHRLGHRHALTAGLTGSYQEFNPQNTAHDKNGMVQRRSFPRRSLYTATTFAEDEMQAGIFRFNAGIRYSLFASPGGHTTAALEPRAAIQTQLSADHSVWISYNRMVQPLFSASKLFLNFPLDFWLPSAGQKPETADQFSAGWQTSALKNFSFTVEAYYKKSRNLSMILSLGDYLMGEEEPLAATGEAYGIELLGQYRQGRLSVTGGYTYARTKRTVNGTTFPFTFDAPHRLNLSGSYTTLEQGARTHTLSMNVEARSGYPYVLSQGSYALSPEAIFDLWSGADLVLENNPVFPNVRLKPYFRTDVSYTMEKQLKRGSRTWQISIMNLTAYTNPYLIYRDTIQKKYKYDTLIPFLPGFSYKRTF